MPNISISKRFFKEERNNFRSWPTVFFRELLQNSVDAGASDIQIQVDQADDSPIAKVVFSDNGCGMSRDVLENVYFKLGETTKDTDQTIGGFGRARLITCFSHHKWAIQSDDYRTKGEGTSYEIEDRPSSPGCCVQVDVDATLNENIVNMQDKLHQYLAQCQLSCNVIINGERWTNWCYKRQAVKQLSFGTVYVNKSQKDYRLLVRVHGALMFSRPINAPVRVIVEIDPNKSRSVLISNRDSLHEQFQDELDKFVQEIAIDSQSALQVFYPETVRIGERCHRTGRRRKIEKVQENLEPIAAASRLTEEGLSVSPDKVAFNVAFGTSEQISSSIPPFICHIDTARNKIRRLYKQFYDPRRVKLSSNRFKLFRIWEITVRNVIEEWLELRGEEFLDWAPGFVFSDEKEACCMSQNNVHDILLNPLDSQGRIKWSVRKPADRAALVSLAVHEVAHCLVNWHDERFANHMTDLTKRVFVASRLRQIYKEMDMCLGKS